jgi:hypothetical protein
MNDFPKILIVGANTFDGSDATSITLKNLYSRWDKDKIAFIYLTSNSTLKNNSKHIFPVSRRKFFNLNSPGNTTLIQEIKSARSIVVGVQGLAASSSLKNKFFNFLHTVFSAYYSLVPYQYSSDLDGFIRKFKPDIIYSPLGSIGIMKLVLKVSNKYNLPVVPHFMDDWVTTMFANNLFLTIPRLAQNRYLHKILKLTVHGFTISEKMATEYTSRYKKPFVALMNCVEIPKLDLYSVKQEHDDCIRFSFCGGLHLNRWVSLVFLCNSLRNTANIKKIEFQIYTTESDWELYKNHFQKFPFVHYMGFVPNSDLLNYQIQQDVLIHVESFDKKIMNYTRLSISTKIPEYLALKKTIIAVGPPGIASIEYLKENNCAIIVDSYDEERTQKILSKLFDEDSIQSLSNNSYSLFLKNHTLDGQSKLLREHMILNTNILL